MQSNRLQSDILFYLLDCYQLRLNVIVVEDEDIEDEIIKIILVNVKVKI